MSLGFIPTAYVPCPTSGPSMPQGDPMGPVIMTLWAWLGWLHAERLCSGVPGAFTRIYVDNRSVVVSRAWALSERYYHWSQWSATVGLYIYQANIMVIFFIPVRRTILCLESPNIAKLDIELFGFCSMASRYGIFPREIVRIDGCCKTLLLLVFIFLLNVI